MARLNSLFPALVYLQGSKDFILSPISAGLRDTVRFCVYQFLVSNDPFGEQQQAAIQMKLFAWCNLPGYARAHKALQQYTEESKKLEEVCFDALHITTTQLRNKFLNTTAPPIPNPLLKGTPGRELAAAETDGEALMRDLNDPEVEEIPREPPRVEYDQHPLASELALKSHDKVQLGLVLPRNVDTRDF